MTETIGGIIWDWNGTLLNDIELCVQTINEMLQKRNLQKLTVDEYREVFSFPVKDYYQKIGFDFNDEPFDIPALEFIEEYNCQVKGCKLHENSVSVLNYFQSVGIRQFILSAMKQDALDQCLEQQNISQYFEHISGLDNHYAASKIENGQQLISELNLIASELILIGDTVHDFEVARELGCQCVLIANGHQSKHILESTGVLVIDELNQLLY
ncbi:MAG: HAD hydrolase-like protein [Bacteroidota bacterium]|nr:HAD hydrolase-like protein [Bacteroidota bacterium]MDP3432472.1 HAD hydrolase-like protein [Bacteroidota bacterium]